MGNKIAILVYGHPGSERHALTEEKYKDLALAFQQEGFQVRSVLFHDEIADGLAEELLQFDAVLVWVNPIEQGNTRFQLDAILTKVAAKGCFVSAHPESIIKMGTKDVLYKIKDMDWGSDTHLYNSYEEFYDRFPRLLESSGIRVLKQYRGNGGNGVFKISKTGTSITVVHAGGDHEKKSMPAADFFEEFRIFFSNDGLLIDQSWNPNMVNGMVRCYLTGSKVSGFGYQEINALYEQDGNLVSPSKRYYFTENCGLFQDLKMFMEKNWISELQQKLSVPEQLLPVIWDADFFINKINTLDVKEKYTLCEINTSSVSPFPPSAIPFMVAEVRKRLNDK